MADKNNSPIAYWQKIRLSYVLLAPACLTPLITPFLLWLANNDKFNEFAWGTFGEGVSLLVI
jgi:hypothetical protein